MLKSLRLVNFRNYSEAKVEFAPGLTVLTGANGSGKTNLLEALGLVGTLRSLRGAPLSELGQAGSEQSYVEVGTERDLLSIAWEHEKLERHLLSGGKAAGVLELIEKFPVVIFVPDDLLLLTREPGLRRKFLDSLLVRREPSFALTLRELRTVLRSRNALLKSNGSSAELDFWEHKIAQLSHTVWQARFELVKILNTSLSQQEFLPGLKIEYNLPELASDEEQIFEALGAHRTRDREHGQTHLGPHRDDWRILQNGRALRYLGSRGEQRMAVSVLKIAEAECLSAKRGVPPLLLLDDIFSELDPHNQEILTQFISQYQAVLTAVYWEGKGRVLWIEGGRIHEKP